LPNLQRQVHLHSCRVSGRRPFAPAPTMPEFKRLKIWSVFCTRAGRACSHLQRTVKVDVRQVVRHRSRRLQLLACSTENILKTKAQKKLSTTNTTRRSTGENYRKLFSLQALLFEFLPRGIVKVWNKLSIVSVFRRVQVAATIQAIILFELG